ncbi:MAG: aldo/keto reductase [Flavobacteriales bacterium]|nr:aldo/keto reductase [Flavobacteriales bacterium]MCB9447912.1 aldo/keto reductase [Flavobacteriales bacterium]
MKYTTLGNTQLKVSKICLGTMTWGQQNTEAEAHEQMDYAWEQGVNFMDAAEMYPVPRNTETQGRTETYIGTWLQARKNRDKVILATKIAGPDDSLLHIRNPMGFGKEQLADALHKSLKRLQTDYIDLYQLHWPERNTSRFGTRYFPGVQDDGWKDNFAEVLTSLKGFMNEGKIRYIGVSNELPWGVMRFLEEHKNKDLPRIQSIQNAYNLLNRTFEYGLSEIAEREQVGLLAYSPLAFGLLSGKYYRGTAKPQDRLLQFAAFKRYSGKRAGEAVESYVHLADETGISPATLALAYVNDRSFVTSNIIGATTMEQLNENIASINVTLDEPTIKRIEEINRLFPDPAP